MDRDPIIVRRAAGAEAPAIAEVYVASRRGAAQFIPTVHSDDEMRQWIAGYLLPTLDVWVAEAGGAIVAMMAMEGDSIEQLYVAPPSQRRGIGDALLKLAKKVSPVRLRLYTFEKNAPARRFYEARGFRAIEFTDGARNEEREPDVLYEWTPNR